MVNMVIAFKSYWHISIRSIRFFRVFFNLLSLCLFLPGIFREHNVAALEAQRLATEDDKQIELGRLGAEQSRYSNTYIDIELNGSEKCNFSL